MKVGIIGGGTIGTPTEIYEALHGRNQKVVLITGETANKSFRLESIYKNSELIRLPLTRAERRRLNHKIK